MARIDKKGRIHGTVGPVVYRSYREMDIIQGKPRTIKQTAGSVRSSAELGLSSSTAAVIRRAFEPAYIHRDGRANNRTTTQVYRSLRNNLTGSPGQRDLHDANLQDLVGMDFNAEKRLSEVLQLKNSVIRDQDGYIDVHLSRFTPREQLKLGNAPFKRPSLCRIRLMAVAFDFRKEYLEYLAIEDVDLRYSQTMEEQTIRLKCQADPGCMVLLSMSILLYDKLDHTGEAILLNNKEFSPCAIIATYPAERPSPNPSTPLSISQEAYPERYLNMQAMGYEGNRLLKKIYPLRFTQGQTKRYEGNRLPEETDCGKLANRKKARIIPSNGPINEQQLIGQRIRFAKIK